ncbi:MAG: M48 family metallopeptidase [Thermoanaerobaculia bacterium]
MRNFPIVGWTALLSMLAVLPATGQEISNLKLYRQSVEAAATAVDRFGTVDDPVELQRVTDIGYRLAVESSYRDFPFSFYLVDMAAPNAFALPGGQIFVTRGMLALGLTDDMLACLLGHEIAHVTQRHGTRMQKRALWLSILSQAALLGVLIGASDEPENPNDPYGYQTSRKGSLVQGTAAAGLAISELLLRNYSRDFEDEADDEGQRLAAAAGFDPDGARQLWELMNSRIPQSKEYGYWRTHPFSDSRMNAARVRAEELKILEGRPPEDYRARTQKVILAYGEDDNDKPEVDPFIKRSALTAWPQGPRAEALRIEDLHRRRELVLAAKELERDYGELIREYRLQIEEVRRLTPETAFVAKLEKEMSGLRDEVEALYPQALEVWKEGLFPTPFLETFASNYPTSEVIPEVALALGNAYSRLGRQADGVRQYLRAVEVGPETEAGQHALTGLRNLAPVLDELTALQQLADRAATGDLADPGLEELAGKRLAEVVTTYENIAHGADYLRQYPDGEHASAVGERLEALARNLYGEVVLYQGVGDHVKALERIQQILTHAPQSQAAESLRDRAVVDS